MTYDSPGARLLRAVTERDPRNVAWTPEDGWLTTDQRATRHLDAIDSALALHPCLVPAGQRGWFDDDLNRFISARSIAQHWDMLDGLTVKGRVADALTRRGPWWQ